MKIYRWFVDGHPQSYHLVALLLVVVALGMTATSRLLAEDSIGTNGATSVNIPVTTCTYSYGSWSACFPNGIKTRQVTGMTPSGCVQENPPQISATCTYVAPQCSYTYSDWGDCQSNNEQVRKIVSRLPAGCVDQDRPSLTRSCTYSAPTATTTTTTTTPTCSYTYSDWTTCQSDGKKRRVVVNTTPDGCTKTTSPYIVESCTYSSTSAVATQCLYTYSNWGACQDNNKRKRTLQSKAPTACEEYVKPVVEQSCVYDTSSETTEGTETTENTEITADNVVVETPSTVTPPFSFINVREGMTLKGSFEIKGEVAGAQSVEYFLVRAGSNTHKYIGQGTKVSEKEWRLNFRTGEFPNGEFYVRAKIRNMYGEYGSGQRKIFILNDDGLTVSTTNAEDGFAVLVVNNDEVQARLQKIEKEIGIPAEDGNGEAPAPDQQKQRILSYCESSADKCFLERDSDGDGLSDIDEVRYGTNPSGADSDFDGFIDGDEVKSGFDPVKYSPGDQSDRILFEDPKVAGETKSKYYVVENVELKDDGSGKKSMRLTGKGLPNSFVTIYVYSDPIVLTVKTDSDGNWVYELDKELADGEHEAYVAITDNTGKITGKSEPLPFVKTAQAVTVIPVAEAVSPTETLPVTKNRNERDLLFLAAIIIAALAATLATIGLIRHRHNAIKPDGLS